MALDPEKFLVLPECMPHKAPSCHHTEALWFNKEKRERNFDRNCERALIAKGINSQACPMHSEWASFVIAGGIIAALTGKYIMPPDPEPLDWENRMERIIWEFLWEAVEKHPEELDRGFMAAMLSDFLPRQHYSPPDRPFNRTYFSENWKGFGGPGYPDTWMQPICNVRSERLKSGIEAFDELPEQVQQSIQKVVRHIPTMLDIAIARIGKRRY